MNLRARAALALAPVLQRKTSLEAPFARQLNKISDIDKGLFHQFCYGLLRQYGTLDTLATALLSKPLKSKDSDIYALILLGLFQLRELRIPDHAAISETVEAARQLNKHWAGKLVNAVLRNYTRQHSQLESQLQASDVFQTAHPQWLLERIKTAWPGHWQAIIRANNTQPPLALRVNQRRLCRQSYLMQLAQAGYTASPCAYSDVGILLDKGADITQLPGFTEGLFAVQDEAAQLAAPLIDAQAGEAVLDACCAPGGKTCHILERSAELASLMVCVGMDDTASSSFHTDIPSLATPQAALLEWKGPCQQ